MVLFCTHKLFIHLIGPFSLLYRPNPWFISHVILIGIPPLSTIWRECKTQLGCLTEQCSVVPKLKIQEIQRRKEGNREFHLFTTCCICFSAIKNAKIARVIRFYIFIFSPLFSIEHSRKNTFSSTHGKSRRWESRSFLEVPLRVGAIPDALSAVTDLPKVIRVAVSERTDALGKCCQV